MPPWPAIYELRDHVRGALDSVAARSLESQIAPGAWTREIFVSIKDRLIPLGLECQAFRQRAIAKENGFIDGEFTYDFTANIYHTNDDHFLIQTFVAGESEWNHGEVREFWDFHKLLQSDEIICFYVLKLSFSL